MPAPTRVEETEWKKQLDFYGTFAHYSYVAMQCEGMILDIQGVGTTLTDLQVTCVDTGYFHFGNLGVSSINNFFELHKCGELCKKLKICNIRIDVEAEAPQQNTASTRAAMPTAAKKGNSSKKS